ncbi:hypothetical protein DL897_12270 [Thermoflavimicrobium daqui]|uniref:Uncharacterized protein n=1 Tax=Thermoflavimicrobium daqui TaxID=2137476 RepID=A0A364K3N7_9BACL|nr:hypothetical protein DL897_12270 [Thermoflavimicrobium daqui]
MKISYEELEEYLYSGREIEFTYQGDQYSITNTQNGFSFCKFYSNTPQNFTTPQMLLENVKINCKSLKEIWSEVEVDILY